MDESKHFGKYEILEELGRGGFGVVYRARETVLNIERALKVLHSNLLTDETFLTRFKREARLSAQLEHPNIVPVYEFGQAEGMNYLAMKYMPGGSLKELLARQGRLSLEETLRYFEDICSGVDFAHQKGVIHRDLKPSNLLIDEFGHMRVSDFGFAKAMATGESAAMSSTGSMVGTPAYMAPEIWRGKPATVQSDVYSLGCILYEMLTGKVLFEGETPAEVVTKHVVDGPEYGEGLSHKARKVIDRALCKDPAERHSTASHFCFSATKTLLQYTFEEDPVEKSGMSDFQDDFSNQQHEGVVSDSIVGEGRNILAEQHAAEGPIKAGHHVESFLQMLTNPPENRHDQILIEADAKLSIPDSYSGIQGESFSETRKSKSLLSIIGIIFLVFLVVVIILSLMPASWWCYLSFNRLPGCY